MNIYIELTLVACIAIFIVDISGITETLLDILSRAKGKRVDSLKPFTCSLCMTFWCCLIWAAVKGEFGICTIAFTSLLSALSFPIAQVFIFVREVILKGIGELSRLLGL